MMVFLLVISKSNFWYRNAFLHETIEGKRTTLLSPLPSMWEGVKKGQIQKREREREKDKLRRRIFEM